VRDEFGIAGSAHFGDVQAGDFNFRTDAVGANPAADQAKDDAANDDVPGDARNRRDDLGEELLERMVSVEEADDVAGDVVVSVAIGSVGEESDGEYAPQSTDAVNADRSDGVVDAFAFHEEDAPDDDEACDDADEERGHRADKRAGRGDGDETAEHAVAHHGRVWLAVDFPQEDACRHGGSAGGEHGVDRDQADAVGRAAKGGAGIEAEPAEGEYECADNDHGHVMTEDGAGVPVFVVFSDARTDHPCEDEGERSALKMDNGRAGIIDGAMAEAAVDAEAGKPSAAPHPAAIGAVYESADADAEEAETFEAPALGQCAGGDGGGGVHENHHVEKEHEHAGRDGIPAEEKSAEAADSPVFSGDREIEHVAERRSTIEIEGSGSADEGRSRTGRGAVDAAHHECVAANEKPDHAEGINQEIHAHGVSDVFGAAHAGFDQCEAGDHEHDEKSGEKRPDEIDGPGVFIERPGTGVVGGHGLRPGRGREERKQHRRQQQGRRRRENRIN